jgi:hypothetical protein
VNLVNVNAQLCPDPSANVAIMHTPRIYTGLGPWIASYGQTASTKTLQSTNVVPATFRKGYSGHSAIQSQRVVSTASGATSLVSNMGFSSAPVHGGYVQSLSAETFATPEAGRGRVAPVGSTGYSVSATAEPATKGPSYGVAPLLNRAQSYGAIMASSIPVPGKND